MQAMIALALNRLEKGPAPAAILKSLKEKSLHSDEMGMYWAKRRDITGTRLLSRRRP